MHGRAATSQSLGQIAVVVGEGIGAEVTRAALHVLDAVGSALGLEIEVLPGPQATDIDEYGLRLDKQAIAFFDDIFAAGIPILHGPAGGRYVYDLRDRYDLFVKEVPIRPLAAIRDASIVQPERLTEVDILIVRDNTSGLYQGTFGWRADGQEAFQEAAYRADQVTRVMEVAAAAAASRTGRLAVVLKPGGVPIISRLWRECAERVVPASIAVEFVEIDNACYQVIADPRRFDVMAAPNMFGDVLGDTAAVLLGSRGMSYSANFGAGAKAVYQTAHGAARDLAGKGAANPVAHILSMAWLLRRSLGLADAARRIELAVSSVLESGCRTVDIANATSTVVGTDEFASIIAERILDAVRTNVSF